jgi:hypothetical protein
MATTFNPPYDQTIDVQTGVTTYADKDGNAVTLDVILAYAATQNA